LPVEIAGRPADHRNLVELLEQRAVAMRAVCFNVRN
jgi:hypothetical protein